MSYTRVKNDVELAAMRDSGAMLKQVLDSIEEKIEEGMTGIDIDQIARKELKGLGGKPAFYGYGQPGFPGAICVSVNDEIVHGTPRDIPLEEGDIVGLDFGVKYKGMITDSARTLAVGSISKEAKALMDVTKQSLFAGIDSLKDGVKVGDIASAVEAVIPKQYGIVKDLVGHGVGHSLHEEPNIPNSGMTKGTGDSLKAGMTICIEPMVTLGSHTFGIDSDDKWTIRTLDGSLSAHFEHTILITNDGSEILT